MKNQQKHLYSNLLKLSRKNFPTNLSNHEFPFFKHSNSNASPLHKNRWILRELVRLRTGPQFNDRIRRMTSVQLVHISLTDDARP